MAPRGVCAHLPCVGGEFSSRASSECSSVEPTVGEWDRRRRYRQLVHHQQGGHYRQLFEQRSYYRYPADVEHGGRQYRQLKDLSEQRHLIDCSNEHILLPTDTYPAIVEEEEEEEQSLEIAEHFLVDSTNLYAKVRPKNRRCKLQQLEISESPHRRLESFQRSDHPAKQPKLLTPSCPTKEPQNLTTNLGPTSLPLIPEGGFNLPPAMSATDARLAQLRREMTANVASKSTRVDDQSEKAEWSPKKGNVVRPNPPQLPRLPPVCGRSPPCHCPEDRELAAKLRLRIIKKISTLRRKHLRLRVILSSLSFKSVLQLLQMVRKGSKQGFL